VMETKEPIMNDLSAVGSPEMLFTQSKALSMGVELELQIVNRRDYNLSRGAPDLLHLLQGVECPGEIKPEITEGMIELNSSVHENYTTLVMELRKIRDVMVRQADRLNLGIAGGGTHPFHRWSEQRIFDGPRFSFISDLYGYLAKQFTVFGQHIHIGCASGDDAVYLLHRMSRYIPHFIALSAASPYYQGEDTRFQSSRLNTVFAFPLSGHMPFVQSWAEFDAYFSRMKGFGIVSSMKDFYWDIRPKPEYGTIEIRVCDTPLNVDKAAALAAYAQTLAAHLLEDRATQPIRDVYEVYNYNRFQACRFGLKGNLIDPYTKEHRTLHEDVRRTLDLMSNRSVAMGTELPLATIREQVAAETSEAEMLRSWLEKHGALSSVVNRQCELWRG
jgi:glutamate---cysteine ligase / carboxylate-amine ligase